MKVDLRSWRPTIIVLLLSILPIYIFIVGPDASAALWLGELTPVELLTAVFYVVGAFTAIFAAIRSKRLVRVFFLGWAFCCIVFFGEETSWLQSYLQYKTPEVVAEENSQGEFNLHNLNFVQGEQSDRLGEELGNILNPRTLLNSDRLFQYFFLAAFAFYPLLCRRGPLARFAQEQQLPFPGARLLVYIWYPVLLCSVLIFLTSGPLTHGLNETREMFYAFTIASFIWVAAIPVRSRSGNLGSVAPA